VRGARIGDYLVGHRIAQGGFGDVYEAEHHLDHYSVAIKVLRAHVGDDETEVARFQREARALRLIDHPGVVHVYAEGALRSGRPYFVMERLEGRTLDARLEQQGPLTVREVARVLEPLCGALSAAHAAGIVHRDVKAGNVFLGESRVVLFDFGVAKLPTSEDEVGEVIGTPSCMAPEQVHSQPVDARTDVYALGALIHHMLTGHAPFDGPSISTVQYLSAHGPRPRPSSLAPVSSRFDLVVANAMARDRNERYASAIELLDAFLDVAGLRPRPVRRQQLVVLVQTLSPDVTRTAALLEVASAILCSHGFRAIYDTQRTCVCAHELEGTRGNFVGVSLPDLAKRLGRDVTVSWAVIEASDTEIVDRVVDGAEGLRLRPVV
jgi:serine/threonine-protein kinase